VTAADTRVYLLVLRAQSGDEGAFSDLLRTFGGRTLAHLRTLVGDDADDVQQEVWLTVYRRLAALSNPRAFRTWLFQTTRHRAIDFLRTRNRHRELFDESVTAADQVATPDDVLVDPRRALLGAAFDQLTTLHREVLRLRYDEDLSYSEMALVLGCAMGTVRSRLHNAKQQLQKALIETRQ
jgi:RNA polymerase sigma-70 factor (ECF subfamily)